MTAAAPNSKVIGGAGTGVPLVELVEPLELPLVDEDVDELVLDEVDELVELEPELEPLDEVLLVMLPDVLLVEPPELDELDDELLELELLDEDEPLDDPLDDEPEDPEEPELPDDPLLEWPQFHLQ